MIKKDEIKGAAKGKQANANSRGQELKCQCRQGRCLPLKALIRVFCSDKELGNYLAI